MAKTLIPHGTDLTDEELEKLKRKFSFLDERTTTELQEWNSNPSFGGVILDEQAQFKCYPYDKTVEDFKTEFPSGVIWN